MAESNRLADILGEAVAGVERDSSSIGGSTHGPALAAPAPAPAVAKISTGSFGPDPDAAPSATIATSNDVSSAADDTFGIAYKRVVLPGGKPAAGYSLPTGQAFAGERELEREAEENADVSAYLVSSLGGGTQGAGGGGAADDEFGDDEFGDGSGAAAVPPPPASKAAPTAAVVSPSRTVAARVFSSDEGGAAAEVPSASASASAGGAALPPAARTAVAAAPPAAAAAAGGGGGASSLRGNLVFTKPIAPSSADAGPALPQAAAAASSSGAQAALQAVRAQLAADAEAERRAELADIEKRLLGAGSLAAAPPPGAAAAAAGGGGSSAEGETTTAAAAGKTGKNKMASVAEGDEEEEEEEEEDEEDGADGAKPAKKPAAAMQASSAPSIAASSAKQQPAAIPIAVAPVVEAPSPAAVVAKPPAVPVPSAAPAPPAVPPASASESTASAAPPAAVKPQVPPPAPQQRVVVVSEADYEESLREAAAADFDAASADAAAARAAGRAGPAAPNAAPPFTYAAAAATLLSASAAAPHRASIVPAVADPDQSCLSRLFSPHMAAPLRDERDRIFCCAKQPFSHAVPAHPALMDELFRSVAGTEPRGDWTVIGFQRPEGFETDLRGAGVLGPLCMLWLAERFPAFVAQLYALSRSESQHFPLMAQSLTMTAKALLALRFGRLNKPANAAASAGVEAPVVTVFFECFGALWLEFFRLYRARSGAIAQLGTITGDAVAAVMKDPAAAVAAFRVAMTKPSFA